MNTIPDNTNFTSIITDVEIRNDLGYISASEAEKIDRWILIGLSHIEDILGKKILDRPGVTADPDIPLQQIRHALMTFIDGLYYKKFGSEINNYDTLEAMRRILRNQVPMHYI